MSPKSVARIALMLLCVASIAFAFLLMAMTGPAYGFYALAVLVAIIVGIDQLLGETSGRNDAIERAQRLSARAQALATLSHVACSRARRKSESGASGSRRRFFCSNSVA